MTEKHNFNDMLAYVNQIETNGTKFNHVIKIHFLRNFTIEPIESFLKFYLYEKKIKPTITYSDFGSIKEEILDSTSLLRKEEPEIVVLSLFYHMNDLFLHSSLGSFDEAKKEIIGLFESLIENTKSLILVNTLTPSFYPTLSPLTADILGTPNHYSALNQCIKEYAAAHSHRLILLDWEKYLRLFGEAESIDYRYWYMNKAPFKKPFLNQYALDIAQVIKNLKGYVKKCLVLDCDNTLWGGIIGEDSLTGIQLDTYESPGKIFYDFQQTILSLYKQGILLALCSKNNPEDVWEILDKHPASLLKREHLSAHRINWQDKATNIKELATELNLGLDSFVFVDDNPAECELVKAFLPEVTVLQVPTKELFLLPHLLFKESLFSTSHISEADKIRTQNYQEENIRRNFAEKFVDIEEYLRSLSLRLDIHHTKETEYTRVAQLTQKTNQFNLSVKRYMEQDIKMLATSEHSSVFSLWANDRFGSYGLTGVLIAQHIDNTIHLSSLLLSCRVLSRRIEYAFITTCLEKLRQEWATDHWQIEYLPTNRNAQVKNFLDTLGVCELEKKSDAHVYELRGAPKTPDISFIQINEEQ